MDLEKLTAAPWHVEFFHPPTQCSNGVRVYALATPEDESPWVADCGIGDSVNAEFIALARNAFDVQMRRGWSATPKVGQSNAWCVVDTRHFGVPEDAAKRCWTDPLTALVEADKWMKEQEAKATKE